MIRRRLLGVVSASSTHLQSQFLCEMQTSGHSATIRNLGSDLPCDRVEESAFSMSASPDHALRFGICGECLLPALSSPTLRGCSEIRAGAVKGGRVRTRHFRPPPKASALRPGRPYPSGDGSSLTRSRLTTAPVPRRSPRPARHPSIPAGNTPPLPRARRYCLPARPARRPSGRW
mgnify:CR=1 FL=1